MIANTVKRRVLLMLLAITLATTGIFVILVNYNKYLTEKTASQIGSMYMSELMFQTQDHFESVIVLKNQEALHLSEYHTGSNTLEGHNRLSEDIKILGFEYAAFYDDNGNYETVVGESAWYRNLFGFIEKIKNGEAAATTGYLTKSGQKYLVFGIPAEYEMQNGSTSSVLLLGFNVEKLYDYIHIKNLEQFGSEAKLDIIMTNGAYVLKGESTNETSYFQYILQYGSFVGMDTQYGIAQIEKAMASGKVFSHTVTIDGLTKHIYGAPIDSPENWYFVLSMPQGKTDALLSEQNSYKLMGFIIAAICIFLMFLIVFVRYLKSSYKQIKETEAAKNEAEIANNAKSSFLSNMSHDIRTPMNAIAGFAIIAEENIRQEHLPEALDAIEKMRWSTDYLSSLIGDVLDMSKIESGKLSLIQEATSLTHMATTVDTIAKVRTEMKHQSYNFILRDIICDAIECDATRMNQILINLIGNAVKFTREGGKIDFEIWQEHSQKGEKYVRTCFSVQDNGIGISPDFIDSVFDSFSREESRVRKIEGTGLGLAISKKLVDMMGGSINVESTEGVGTRFTLFVDFLKAEEITVPVEESAAVNTDNIRIIMAEDNDFNYEIAQVLLEGQGFTVFRAENGEKAVAMYSEAPQNYDFILMDIRMPVLNGYQATELIRAFEKQSGKPIRIPIYALSADVFEEDIRRCAEVGMDGHISKPINLAELLRKINQSLNLPSRNN